MVKAAAGQYATHLIAADAVSPRTAMSLFHSSITSQIKYTASVWASSPWCKPVCQEDDNAIQELDNILHRPLRSILNVGFHVSAVAQSMELGWAGLKGGGSLLEKAIAF